MPNAPADSHVRSILPRIRNPIYRTCCATVYACGLRSGEATALEIRTIDSTNLQLRIIGKGNKERIVPLPRPILRALRELWKTHKHPRWLFPNKGGTGPIGRGALNRAFSAAAQEAGIHASTVRSLRHGYATRLIECGVNIRVVQILLKTTTYYPRTPD